MNRKIIRSVLLVAAMLILPMAAWAFGTISGTVTASGSGTPLQFLFVTISDSNGQSYGGAMTNSFGSYTVPGLPVRSDYRVQVPGSMVWGGFTKAGITVTDGNTTTVNFSLAAAGTISGNIAASGSGTPIGGSNVSISDSYRQNYGGVQADSQGNFIVTGLPARSDFRVQVQGNATYAGETKTGIVVTAGNMTTVNFSLSLGGSVAGIVRDAGTSAGLGGIQVFAIDMAQNQWNWMSSAMTNPDGTYQINGLPQGNVRVAAQDQGGWYIRQFYNGVLIDSLATAVTVTSSNITTGIDFNPSKGGTISGTVRNTAGDPIANAEVAVVLGGNWIADSKRTDGLGAFTIGPVPSGVRVRASAPGTNYVGQFYGGVIYENSAPTVTVTAEANTPGIDITLPTGGVMTGTITVDGAVAQDGWVSLYSETDGRWMFNTPVEGLIIDGLAGTWSVAAPAGTYKVLASASQNGYEVPNMYYNGANLFSTATSLTSTGTGTISNVNFALSSQGGTVNGTVSYGGTWAGLVIEWISPNPGKDWPAVSNVTGSPGSAYSLKAAPGTWYVKAFMDVNNNLMYDPGEPFGEYAGGAVTVTNGGTVSNVNITLTGRPAPAPAKIGVFQDGYWYLDKNQTWDWNGAPPDVLGIFGIGLTGAIPVTGDWTGDGITKIGVYIDGIWYLDMNNNWQWDGEPTDVRGVFGVGLPNAVPVTGDWNGDGITEIGIYSNGSWYLDTNRNWQWDGVPIDTSGSFGVGLPNAIPVTGDWTGDGVTKIGVFSNGEWYLDKNANWQWDGAPIDIYGLFGAGLPNVQPVTGDWNGNGITKIGVYSDGYWYLDTNASWQWDGTPTDTFGMFGVGLGPVTPVTGNW